DQDNPEESVRRFGAVMTRLVGQALRGGWAGGEIRGGAGQPAGGDKPSGGRASIYPPTRGERSANAGPYLLVLICANFFSIRWISPDGSRAYCSWPHISCPSCVIQVTKSTRALPLSGFWLT